MLPSAAASQPAKRAGRQLIDTAYEVIRYDIICCRIGPGEKVSESSLAERYGIGRSAVRMALNRLAQDDLVEVEPREGYRITPVTLKDVHDVFGARRLLEPPMARLAANNATDEEVDRLAVLSRSAPRDGDLDSVAAYLEDAKAFHTLVATMGRNDYVASIIGEIFDRSRRMLLLCNFYDTALSRSVDEIHVSHGDLVDAIRRKDGPEAERIMATHVETGRMHLLGVLTTSPSLQSISLSFPAQRG